MKLIKPPVILLICLFCACDTGKQQEAFRLKDAELKQREVELQSREQLVALKEFELSRREQALDSASGKLPGSDPAQHITDSLLASRSHIPGTYNVTMRCTQTNCTGSAVGDTKNEQWHIAYEQNVVVIRAMSDNKLIRIYKGNYFGGAIELEAQSDSLSPSSAGKIIVRLQERKDNQLDGTREITRQDDCRIIYSLDLNKQ